LSENLPGRYYWHVPKRMHEAYESSRNDIEQAALRDEIALIDSRIVELLSRADERGTNELWMAMHVAIEAYEEAGSDSPTGIAARARHFGKMKDLCNARHADYQAWDEIQSLVEQRRKLSDTETKRFERAGQIMTVDEIMELISGVETAIRNHVTDQATLAAIRADIARQIAPRARGWAEQGGDETPVV
jgi:hypothetical protein